MVNALYKTTFKEKIFIWLGVLTRPSNNPTKIVSTANMAYDPQTGTPYSSVIDVWTVCNTEDLTLYMLNLLPGNIKYGIFLKSFCNTEMGQVVQIHPDNGSFMLYMYCKFYQNLFLGFNWHLVTIGSNNGLGSNDKPLSESMMVQLTDICMCHWASMI